MKPGQKYFLPFQAAWFEDRAALRICVKSRQVGLSYADSYDSVRKAAARWARDLWVMSRDENQARQYIRYCRRWARVLGIAAEQFGEQIFTKDGAKPITVQVLAFDSTAGMYALS